MPYIAGTYISQEKLDKLEKMEKEAEEKEAMGKPSLDANGNLVMSDALRKKFEEENELAGKQELFDKMNNTFSNAIDEHTPSLDFVGDAKDYAQGIIQGGANLAQTIIWLSNNLSNDILGTNLDTPDLSHAADNFGSGRQGTIPDLLRGMGEYSIPYGALSAESKVATLLQKIIKEGTAGLTSGFVNNPNNRAEGATEGFLANAGVRLGLGTLEKLRPTNLAKKFTNLTRKQLLENAKAARGTKTPISHVLNSDKLKSKYNTWIMPFDLSGAKDRAISVYDNMNEQTKNIVKSILKVNSKTEFIQLLNNKAENLIKNITGTKSLSNLGFFTSKTGSNLFKKLFGTDSTYNIDDKAQKILKKNYEKQSIENNRLYKRVNEIADRNKNLNIDTPNFSTEYKKVIDDLNENPLLKNNKDRKALISKVFQSDPESAFDTIEKITYDPYGIKKTSKERVKKSVTLDDVRQLKSELYKMKSESNDAQDRYSAKIFNKLATSLDKDFNNIIEKSGDNELINANNIANANYIKNYLPFINDSNVFKYIYGNKRNNPDGMLKSLFNLNKPNLAKTANFVLGEEGSKLGHLSLFSSVFDEDGNISPQKFMTAFSKLMETQSASSFIPNKDTLSSLSIFKNMSKVTNFVSKFVNEDGEINLDKMAKQFEGLQDSFDSSYKDIVMTKGNEKLLNDFLDSHALFKKLSPILSKSKNPSSTKLINILDKNEDIFNNLTKEQQEALNNLKVLMNMNPINEDPRLNPPTGNRLTKGFAALLAGLVGNKIAGTVGALVASAAAGASAIPIAAISTSEKLRNSLILNMLKRNSSRKFTSPKSMLTTQTAAQGFVNSNGDNRQ